MCLAVPGRIVEIPADNPFIRLGKVNFAGVVRQVSLDLVPEAEVGDYVLVHTGYAIEKMDEQAADEALELLRELGLLDEETGLLAQGL